MEQGSSIKQNMFSVTNNAITDNELVDRVKVGDSKAFEVIMRRYNQRLYRIARSILIDNDESMDVVQEAYVKAYYQFKNFNGPDGLATWLSRIVSNEALMRIRKSKRIEYTLDDSDSEHLELTSLEHQPMDKLASEQLKSLLEEAIESLPVDYRCVYVMRAIQQLSTRETSKSLEITEDLVKTRYLRARRALQTIFEGHIEQAGLEAYEFAGHRCDSIVESVLGKLEI